MPAICHKSIWKGALDGGKDEINRHDWVTAEAGRWIQSNSSYYSAAISH